MAASVIAGIPALKDNSSSSKPAWTRPLAGFSGQPRLHPHRPRIIQMLDQVKVDYYGTPTPLNQVGQLTTPDANLIVIQPWDTSIISRDRKGAPHLRPGLQSQ